MEDPSFLKTTFLAAGLITIGVVDCPNALSYTYNLTNTQPLNTQSGIASQGIETEAEVLMAQTITPANDGTGTVVNQVGNQYNIAGGTTAGANLFHSFEQLNLSPDQVANFLAQPEIQNILGRVVGDDPSMINGLLQITGSDANLFLMNPAGIIFGPNASISIPGSFTATAANGIQIGEEWFNALGSSDYTSLVGEPTGFAFTGEGSGAVVNTGNLGVVAGESITLVGGTVVNLGTISAPGGNITIAAVPGEQLIRISQEGSLVSLDLPIAMQGRAGGIKPVSVTDLLAPLSGGGDEQNLAWVIEDDSIRLASNGAGLPIQSGNTTIAGTVDASSISGAGGTIDLLGEQVALTGATVIASGNAGGGQIRVGGDYQGQGTIPNAENTFVSSDSTIAANAGTQGSGGRVIIWADDSTRFYGNISAHSGSIDGDGGFVEVSGHENLAFDGEIDVTATHGDDGTLLLDPRNIFIVRNQSLPNNNEIGDSRIGAGDGENLDFIISASALTQQGGQVILQANENIVVQEGVSLAFSSASQVIFNADFDRNSSGAFLMDPSQSIVANNASISISANAVRTGNISSNGLEITAFGGDIRTGDISGGRISVVNESENGSITSGRIDSSTNIITNISESFGRRFFDESPAVTFTANQGNITLQSIQINPSDTEVFLEALVNYEIFSPPSILSIRTAESIRIEGITDLAGNPSIDIDLTGDNFVGTFRSFERPRDPRFIDFEDAISIFSDGLNIRGGTQVRVEFSISRQVTNIDGDPIFSSNLDSFSTKLALENTIGDRQSPNPGGTFPEVPIPEIPVPEIPVPETPGPETVVSKTPIPEASTPKNPNSEGSNNEIPDSGSSNSENSNNGNSDDSGSSDSGNADPGTSESETSSSENSNSGNSNSEVSNSETSDSDNSESEESDAENSDSENSTLNNGLEGSDESIEDSDDLGDENAACEAFQSSDVLDISLAIPEECLTQSSIP